MRRSMAVAMTLVLALAMAGSSPALAAAGDLDPDFGTYGTTITSFAPAYSSASDIALQSNDRIVTVGSANGDFVVMRYTVLGLPDPTFGSDGIVTTSFSPGEDLAHGVAIQSDGKIVVVGTANYEAIAVARYTMSGVLDPTFSGDGKARAPAAEGADVGIQSDGRIVVMGHGYDSGRNKITFLALRFGMDGRRDLTFGTEGVSRVSFGRTTQSDQAWGGALDQLDRIIMVGSAADKGFGVARLLPDGSHDPDFGINGKTTTPFGAGGSGAYDVAIQADGRPVVVGYAVRNRGFDTVTAVARYRLGGSLDPTFSDDGKTTTAFANDSEAWGVAIDASARIVTAGSMTYQWAIARYRSNGNLDPTFGGDGKVTTNLTDGVDRARAVAVQTNSGRIVAAGYATFDLAIAGYLGA